MFNTLYMLTGVLKIYYNNKSLNFPFLQKIVELPEKRLLHYFHEDNA